jgi:hypothetical protein
MSITSTISHILFFFLILLQAAGLYYRNVAPVDSYAVETVQTSNTADCTSLDNSTAASAMSEVLYSPETLLLPDALLSPIPSFQFGFIEVLASFLFLIFSFSAGNICLGKKPLVFTNSYFHTLFLSVILINAP